MDKFTFFEIRKEKGKHAECKIGIYKEGKEYYKKYWPLIGLIDDDDDDDHHHFHPHPPIIIHGIHGIFPLIGPIIPHLIPRRQIGCDNCVELWLRDQPDLKYGLDEMTQQKNKSIEKLNTLDQVTLENNQLKQDNEKLNTLKDQFALENNQLKQDNEKLNTLKDQVTLENNQLKQDNRKLNTLKDQVTLENNQLKQDNQTIKSDFTNFKNSIKIFVSSIDLGVHQNLAEDLNKLNNIIEQAKQINLKEIRNMKLDGDSCTLDLSFYEDFLCYYCSSIVDNPVSCSFSSCDRLTCRDCTNKIKDICPFCQKDYKEAPIGRRTKNSLSRLNFTCPLKCSKEFTYENKEKHFTECPNWDRTKSTCSLCNMFLVEDFKNHSKTCEKLRIKCFYCNIELSKLYLEEHIRECNNYTKPCETCKTGFPNKFEKAHSEFYCNKIVTLKKQIEDFIQFS